MINLVCRLVSSLSVFRGFIYFLEGGGCSLYFVNEKVATSLVVQPQGY